MVIFSAAKAERCALITGVTREDVHALLIFLKRMDSPLGQNEISGWGVDDDDSLE
jgi:hypothetical protein